MKKNNLIDFLIIILVYIGVSSMPFDLFIPEAWLVSLFRIVAQVLILGFIIIFVQTKSKLVVQKQKLNKKYVLFLLPTFLVCFSNYFYVLFLDTSINFVFTFNDFLNIVLTLFVVINEELIFRILLISNLEKQHKWWTIGVSGVVFGLCHITRFLSSFNPFDLIVILYTIPLGILLAILYVYSGSNVLPCILHFLFNVFNDIIFACFNFSNQDTGKFILVNALLSVVVVLYLVALFLINKKTIQENTVK